MRGIMMARKKPLNIVEPSSFEPATVSVNFEKPAAKSAIKMVDASNVGELVSLLHNEAKVI
jgi:electron transfer flavoprotein beta subunit